MTEVNFRLSSHTKGQEGTRINAEVNWSFDETNFESERNHSLRSSSTPRTHPITRPSVELRISLNEMSFRNPFAWKRGDFVPAFTRSFDFQEEVQRSSGTSTENTSPDAVMSDLEPDCLTTSEASGPRTVTMARHITKISSFEVKHKATYAALEKKLRTRGEKLDRTQDHLDVVQSELREVHAHWN